MKEIEVSGKTVEEAITNATIELGTTSDQMEYEIVDRGSTGLFGLGSKPAIIRAKKKEVSLEESIDEFLVKVCKAMGLMIKTEIRIDEAEKTIYVDLLGDDMGILIGKRGQTLDSLQYLTSLMINKTSDIYFRVKLDTENYRERRKATLENLAKNIASKVKKTRRSVNLEPMNPYERRIIHSALQDDPRVKTFSQGEDPNRYVVVSFKRA